MAHRHVAIIGAGLAGLSAGCYARMNGCSAHIYEHHSVPGGVVAAWKRGEYLIDGGVHFLMGYRPGQPTYELYRELGILPACSVVDLATYARFVDPSSGHHVDLTSDLDKLASDIGAISPGDAPLVESLVSGAKDLRGRDILGMGMAKPPELMGPIDRARSLWQMRHLWRHMSGTFAGPASGLAAQAQHPFVRRLIESLFLPEVPVWFLLMLLTMLEQQQLGLLERGSLDLARALERRYLDLGGEVTYRATVTRILVENDRAVGVELADGAQHRADAVISAADGYSTIFELLGGRYADRKTRARYEDWPLFRPTVMASFGVAREFPGVPSSTALMLGRPLAAGSPVSDVMWVRVFNYSDAFAPTGRTVVQASFETDWDYWECLRADRARYNEEKKRVAEDVLEALETCCPGVSSAVEMTDAATPYTTWRYTRNRRGAYEGWLPSPKAIMTQIPRTLPGLASFYMAGQWVVPGGGVPPCLYSGRQAIQLLCHEESRR